jgi:hypothetical protein
MDHNLTLILLNPITMIVILLLLGSLGGGIAALIQQWMENHHKRQLKELDVRKVEALASMGDRERQLLLDQMPDWIDADDPAEIEAFKQARKEAIRR